MTFKEFKGKVVDFCDEHADAIECGTFFVLGMVSTGLGIKVGRSVGRTEGYERAVQDMVATFDMAAKRGAIMRIGGESVGGNTMLARITEIASK